MSKRIPSFNCYELGSSREYVAELVKQYDLVALQEIWLFPWDLAVPSTLGIDVKSFSLSSIDVTNGIKAGHPYGGITFIWHRDFGYNIQVKRYESDRILMPSVKMNRSSILFINVYFPVACHEKYEEYIMCLGVLSSILESHEEDHVCILGDFNATPGSPRFNEICDMLHENSVMLRDTDILPDNTCTHVNNGSQTCSWLDHIAMSDVLSESTVDCHTLPDVACSDHCAITVTLNFDQLPMTHSIEGQKAKHIN